MIPDRIGRYRITSKLGEGGMGIVYAAHDERLNRSVAIKTIRDPGSDERSHERFWREARSAASVNHPNVCQLYEIGDEGGQLFIAMELLEGQSLALRIAQGPLSVAEAGQLVLAMLGALDALHRRGLVHRDLKPSNVFLTAHGVKLLDFGLARPIRGSVEQTETGLTLTGTTVGTPGYMAPEQALGQPVDARTDLFSVGAMLYEMLTGKQPFAGESPIQVLHSVVYERVPSLGGSPAIGALDRIIQRAAAKKPEDRYPTADQLAHDLRAALLLVDTNEAVRIHPVTRLMVLPLRILRPDPETDFLAFSLPDAISSTLAGLESLLVRSSAAASRFSSERPDLKTLAAEADVDVVLIGTLVRAGEQLRVSTQLLEVPGGTILWSHADQVPLRDTFQLQDDLAHRIVESLSLPLTAREHRLLRHDVPASAKAYEFYLRANELASHSQTWGVARELYERCLEEDPRYAPAWARLGRIYRVLAKYKAEDTHENVARAEAAFKRALEINADLSVAHNLSVYLDADLGRAQEAMQRLLNQVKHRTADPEVFAGLCHACRYCGLLEASVAAHEHARRLDKTIATSVIWTFWLLGDYRRAVDEIAAETVGYIPGLVLASLGRQEEAIVALKRREQMTADIHVLGYVTSLRALLEGNRQESIEAVERTASAGYTDPEGLYFLARSLAYVGETERAIGLLERSIVGGYVPFSAMARDGWLDPLRSDPRFTANVRRAEARHREAQTAFIQAAGDRALGLAV